MLQRLSGLYIALTDHRGRGVFCAHDITEGDLIEICPIIILPKDELDIIHKTSLHDYYFLWGEERDIPAIALGNGSIYNHETHPNADFILDFEDNTIEIVAIKSINAGEEITINYHGEPGNTDTLWFNEK